MYTPLSKKTSKKSDSVPVQLSFYRLTANYNPMVNDEGDHTHKFQQQYVCNKQYYIVWECGKQENTRFSILADSESKLGTSTAYLET